MCSLNLKLGRIAFGGNRDVSMHYCEGRWEANRCAGNSAFSARLPACLPASQARYSSWIPTRRLQDAGVSRSTDPAPRRAAAGPQPQPLQHRPPLCMRVCVRIVASLASVASCPASVASCTVSVPTGQQGPARCQQGLARASEGAAPRDEGCGPHVTWSSQAAERPTPPLLTHLTVTVPC